MRAVDTERNHTESYHNQYDNLSRTYANSKRGETVSYPTRAESLETFQQRDPVYGRNLVNKDIHNVVHLSVDKPAGRMPPIGYDQNGPKDIGSASYLASPHGQTLPSHKRNSHYQNI